MLTPQRPPPEDYYQNNCRTLFGFVRARYADVLPARASAQLEAYDRLSDAAQRLFARVLTRKGPGIRLDTLNYDEVDDESAAVRELADARFIVVNPALPADQLLNMLRKDELVALADGTCGGMRKAQLVETLLSGRSDEQLRRRVACRAGWLGLADPNLWWLVRLLYFGDVRQDWSSFVVRDLGMVSYENIALDRRQFKNAAALDMDLQMRNLSALSYRLDEQPRLAPELLQALSVESSDRFVNRRRERALLRVGQWLERSRLAEQALLAYGFVQRHPARERAVRILHKQGRTVEAHAGIQAIKREPVCEEEYQFAQRFGRRNAGYQPEQWIAPIPRADSMIEQQAIELLRDQGEILWGAHVENHLVRTLTGLLYWKAIFADVQGAFSNPFQPGPNDLYFDDFVRARHQTVAEIESRIQDDANLVRSLYETWQQKRGVANSLVSWHLLEQVPLEQLLNTMPVDHIRRLCRFLIRNLPQRRRGFPDLLVAYGDQRYEFLEVKGPNDQLQPGQRVWLRHLERLEIPARVLKLKLSA